MHQYSGQNREEDTFLMLKPDCLERGLENEVLTYIRDYSEELYPDEPLRIRAMQKTRMTPELVEDHYANVDEEILDELHEYFGTTNGDGYEIVPMVVTGVDAVDRVRDMVVEPIDDSKPTFLPENSVPGTIRGDLVTEHSPVYADPETWPHYYQEIAAQEDVPLYNLVHAAEAADDAQKEIERFFGSTTRTVTEESVKDYLEQ